MHTIHFLWKIDSEANSIAIIFCFDLSSGQPIIFACLKGGSLGTTSRSFDITLFIPISARPKIGLPRFIETSQSPISQISLLVIPEVRNTDVSPFLSGKKAAYFTLFSEELNQFVCKINLDNISDESKGGKIFNPKNLISLDFQLLL